jgi:hypothetical protein
LSADDSERVDRLRAELRERLEALEIAQKAAELRFADTKATLDKLQAELRGRSNIEIFDTSKIVDDARTRLNRTRAGMRELVSRVSNDSALVQTLGPEILRIMRRMERKLFT